MQTPVTTDGEDGSRALTRVDTSLSTEIPDDSDQGACVLERSEQPERRAAEEHSPDGPEMVTVVVRIAGAVRAVADGMCIALVQEDYSPLKTGTAASNGGGKRRSADDGGGGGDGDDESGDECESDLDSGSDDEGAAGSSSSDDDWKDESDADTKKKKRPREHRGTADGSDDDGFVVPDGAAEDEDEDEADDGSGSGSDDDDATAPPVADEAAAAAVVEEEVEEDGDDGPIDASALMGFLSGDIDTLPAPPKKKVRKVADGGPATSVSPGAGTSRTSASPLAESERHPLQKDGAQFLARCKFPTTFPLMRFPIRVRAHRLAEVRASPGTRPSFWMMSKSRLALNSSPSGVSSLEPGF
jgi:hypothetical protein